MLTCSLLSLALACSQAPDTFTVNSRPKGDQLATPTGLVATVGSGNVKLEWNPVSGATSYEVYRAAGTATSPYALLASTGLTAYRDIAGYNNLLIAGTTYFYRIMAKTNTGYDGTPTYIDSGLTDPVPAAVATVPAQNTQLAAPTVTVTDANGVRYITWTEVPNATSYDVYRANTFQTFIDQSSPLSAFSAIASNTTALVTAEPVTSPATRYAYTVVARKGDLYYLPSPKSALVYNAVVSKLATPAIAAVSQGVFADKILVEWDKVPNATTYRVYRAESRSSSTNPDSDPSSVVTPYQLVADLTTFSAAQGSSTRLFVEDTNDDISATSTEGAISVQRYYWYKVQAVGNTTWADSSLSTAAWGNLKPDAQVNYSAIDAPTGVRTLANGVNAYVTVRWQQVLASATKLAAASYDVYRAKESTTAGFTRIASAIPGTAVPTAGNELEYQDASATLEKGANYYYRIVARSSVPGLESDLSAVSGAGFIAGLDAITLTATPDTSMNVLFTWSKVRNVNSTAGTAYQIRVLLSATAPAAPLTDGAQVLAIPAASSDRTSAYDTGFAGYGAGTYQFWVVATGNDGVQGWSAPVALTR
jgi:fibronectin type 3 domain-containing protein